MTTGSKLALSCCQMIILFSLVLSFSHFPKGLFHTFFFFCAHLVPPLPSSLSLRNLLCVPLRKRKKWELSCAPTITSLFRLGLEAIHVAYTLAAVEFFVFLSKNNASAFAIDWDAIPSHLLYHSQQHVTCCINIPVFTPPRSISLFSFSVELNKKRYLCSRFLIPFLGQGLTFHNAGGGGGNNHIVNPESANYLQCNINSVPWSGHQSLKSSSVRHLPFLLYPNYSLWAPPPVPFMWPI